MIGGGLPLAAVGGRADVMDELAPLGPVYQAGTLSGNPLATAAGLAVLAQLDDAAYADLEATRHALRRRPARRAGAPRARKATGHPRRHAHRACSSRRRPSPTTWRPRRPTTSRYARFFHALLEAEPRVFLAPSGYETMFVSLAHGDRELDATAEAFAAAADVPRRLTPASGRGHPATVVLRSPSCRRGGSPWP